MLKRDLNILLCSVILMSCKETGISPDYISPKLQPSPLEITQTDYYTYQATAVVISPSNIERIEVGTITDTTFSIKTTVTPNVVQAEGQYLVAFSASATFKDTTSREETIRIRLVTPNGSSTTIDTTIPTYKYPYPSAEIVLTRDNIPTVGFFQDIVFLDDTLYFRPSSAYGLHKYDPGTGTATELFRFPGGDHLAADSGVVFLDDHIFIMRWNSKTQALEQTTLVYYGPAAHTFITGMDIFEGRLLVLGSSDYGHFRCRYDYNGNLIDSVRFDTQGYYLAVRDGILHTNGWGETSQIYRYAFSGNPLPSLCPPVKYGDGIKFHGEFLYYCDYNHRLIGRVPVADLKEMLQ